MRKAKRSPPETAVPSDPSWDLLLPLSRCAPFSYWRMASDRQRRRLHPEHPLPQADRKETRLPGPFDFFHAESPLRADHQDEFLRSRRAGSRRISRIPLRRLLLPGDQPETAFGNVREASARTSRSPRSPGCRTGRTGGRPRRRSSATSPSCAGAVPAASGGRTAPRRRG